MPENRVNGVEYELQSLLDGHAKAASTATATVREHRHEPERALQVSALATYSAKRS